MRRVNFLRLSRVHTDFMAKDERTQVRFSAPDPTTNIIKVSRVLPDGTEESIGLVYPDFGNQNDSITYCSANKIGEELLPPTLDFIEIESQFEKYNHQIAEASYEKDMAARVEEYEKREKAIKGLRLFKHSTTLLKFHHR